MQPIQPWRRWHRPLMVNVALMIGLVVVAGIGLVLDDRTLLGESVWVKPLKFGVAFTVYSGALAWLLTRLRRARRLGWWAGTVFAVAATVEVAAITMQAARGTFSHFNTSTDSITLLATQVFTNGVAVLFLVQLAIVALALLQRDGDRGLKRAVRAGLAMATFGMVVPVYFLATEVHQRTVVDANGREIVMYQGHGIGEAGDFRVPHFVGLHAVQVLLVVFFALRRMDENRRARLITLAALGYTGLLAFVTWQAASGQALFPW